MGKSIGIDLGTTNSVVGVKKVESEIIMNAEGDSITPSCLTVQKQSKLSFLKKSQFIVGKPALEWRAQDPENCVTSIKRLIGRNFDEDEVTKIIENNILPYKISELSNSQNNIAVSLKDKEFTPQELSAEILKKLKKDAEKGLGDKVDSAVITVPSYFNDKQKHATRAAASLAGLKVQRLLAEPTAAAISFGVDQINDDEASNIIVFDFGGGTFDLSILTISGGQFIEQGKGGDMWLGGDDIDKLLSDFVIKAFEEEEDANFEQLLESQDLKRKNKFLSEFKSSVEKAKIALSTDDEAFVEIAGILLDSDNDPIDFDVEISKDDFNELITEVITRTVDLTKSLINDIEFTSDLIDKILLVGGSSRIPAVYAALVTEFGEDKVMLHDRPMLAIAEGAGILSHRLSQSYECPKCGKEVSQDAKTCDSCNVNLEDLMAASGILDIVHSTAHDYFIHLENGDKKCFIERNTPLPCKETRKFKLMNLAQRLVHLKFSNEVNDKDEVIGELWIGITSALSDVLSNKQIGELLENDENLEIEVEMNIDENNLISINASFESFPDIKISKTLSRGGVDESIFVGIENFIDEVNSNDNSEYDMHYTSTRLADIASNANKIVQEETEVVNEDVLNIVKQNFNNVKKMCKEQEYDAGGNLLYLKSLLRDFGDILDKNERAEAAQEIHKYESICKDCNYNDFVSIQKEFRDFVADAFNDINVLRTLGRAIEMITMHKYYISGSEHVENLKGIQALYKNLRKLYPQRDENNLYYDAIADEDKIIDAAYSLLAEMQRDGNVNINKGIQE